MALYLWGTSPIQEESTLPKQILINFPILSIACGEEHLLLLSLSNQLYSMGTNSFGSLGIGSEDYNYATTTPTLIASNIVEIDCGWNHSVALNQNGSAFLWGKGYSIQDQSVPKQVANNIKMIRCGARHTFFLNQQQQLLALGANDSGQCGIQNQKKISELTEVMDEVTNFACGVSHSLIKADKLYACGSNSLNQLGIPQVKQSQKPMPLELPNVSKLAAGNHSAAISNGSLFLWGSGSFGTYTKPVLFLTDIQDVRIGGTLGLAVDNKSQMFAWGSNVNGELGIGDTQPRNEAVRVNLKNVQSFGVGIGYGVAYLKNEQPVQTEKDYLAKTLQIESEERSALEKINRELKLKILEQENNELQQQKIINQKNEEIRSLQGKLQMIGSDYASTESQSKDYKQQCQRYQNVQKEALAQLQKQEDLVSQLESDLKQKTEEVYNLQNQLENFQINLKNYQDDESQQLNEIKNQLSEITEQLAEEQELNEDLTQELIKYKQDLECKTSMIQQYEFEIGNQLNSNRQLAQQMQQHLNQHQKLQEGLQMANHRIESLQTQNAKLMQELSMIRTSLYSDTQKPQVMEIQTVMALNKELTDLNNQLQQKLRAKDQELMKLRQNTQQKEMSRQTSQRSLQKPQVSQQRGLSPNDKTISELLESAHKHAKYMKKILKEEEEDTPSPTRKLEFCKENSVVKQDCLTDVRDRLNKLQQNRQLFEKKLKL